MTTEQEKQKKLPEQVGGKSADKAQDKPPEKPAETAPKKTAGKSSAGRKRRRPQQRTYDHIPIIIVLVVIFSFTLLCIGIGLTGHLDAKRAGIPACGRVPCPPLFSTAAPQKGAGE